MPAFDINFSKSAPARADTAIFLVAEGNTLGAAAKDFDRQAGGLLARFLKSQTKFTGKKGQSITVTTLQGQPYARVILLGAGDKPGDGAALQAAGAKLYGQLNDAGAARAVLFLDDQPAKGGKKAADAPSPAARLAAGAMLQTYRFDKYKTGKDKKEDSLQSLTIVTPDAAAAKAAYAALDAERQGIFFARDLANEPPNVLYPEEFAKRIAAELRPLGVEIEIFDEKRLAKLGFGAHVAVGWGSSRPPRAVVMRWPGAAGRGRTGSGKARRKNAGKPLAFVGKGVTFDTGGISIKPSGGMDEMKYDMCGAAAVAGLMKTLALRDSPTEVIGMVGLAENMPDGAACRPGDIVTTLSGKTVEILNTDAEGRLVLCDALTYVQKTYDPKFVVNLATLTGAILVALGSEYAGAFVNDDDLWGRLDAAGKETGEKLWRMPLDEAYRKAMEGQAGDLRNISTMGSNAGSCTAAGYLESFIDAGRPWAHLDIAAVAWSKGKTNGGIGWGVQLLDRLVAENYE